jgi:hypothetical protein
MPPAPLEHPLSWVPDLPLLAHVLDVGMLLLLAFGALGFGVRLLRRLGVAESLSAGERAIFGLALGYGALALALFALGCAGLFYTPVMWGLVGAWVAVGGDPAWATLRVLGPGLRRAGAAVRRDPVCAVLAGVILLVALAALVQALVPVATQDDLMYHLALPRRYVADHVLRFYADSTYSLFPQMMEMLYTGALLLGSDRLAVLFAFSAGLIGPAAAALFARRHLGGRGPGAGRGLPLLVAALFLSTPLVVYVLRAANTDLAQASFDFLGLYAFYLAARAAWSPRLLALAGLCCGLALSVKYYGFAVALILGLILFGALIRTITGAARRATTPETGTALPPTTAEMGAASSTATNAAPTPTTRNTQHATRNTQTPSRFTFHVSRFTSYGAAALLAAAPWFVRNLVAAGNPVWPLGGSVFGGAYLSAEFDPTTLLGRAPGLSLENVGAGLAYLWTAMTRPALTIDGQAHEVTLGLLLLPALLALPLARWTAAVRLLAGVGAGYWVLWAFLFSHTSARYLATFFLIAAVLGAYGLVEVARRWQRVGWLIGTVVAAGLVWLAGQAAWGSGPYLPVALALDGGAERQYLARTLEDYPMLTYLDGQTPATARIYVWDGQPRGYYLPRPYVYARLVPLYSGFGGPLAPWRQRLADLGLTHVLVHTRDILAPGQPAGTDPQAAAGQAFAAAYFGPPLFSSGD